MQELLSNDAGKLKQCNEHHVAMLANAFCKLDINSNELFQKILEVLLDQEAKVLRECSSQELAMLTNAFSGIEIFGRERLFAAIQIKLLEGGAKAIQECEFQHLAMIANGLSKVELPGREKLFEAVQAKLLQGGAKAVQECKSYELAMIVNGFSKVEIPGKEGLFAVLQAKLLQSGAKVIQECKFQHLAMIANGFSKVEISGREKLFEAVQAKLLEGGAKAIQECDSQALAMIVNSYGKVELPGREKLFVAVQAKLLQGGAKAIQECTSQTLAMIAWSFIIFQYDTGEVLLSKLVSEVSRRANNSNIHATLFKNEEIDQLLQVRLAIEYLFPQWKIEWGKDLNEFLHRKEIELQNSSKSSSNSHLEVYTVLKEMIIGEILNEKYIRCLSCDMLIKKRKLVIEYHGPFHYVPASQKLEPISQFKIHLLQKMGYQVLVVPYWEWGKIRDAQVDKKKEYLTRRLSQLDKMPEGQKISLSDTQVSAS